MPMNIGELLARTTHSLDVEGIVTARLDAEVLLSRYLRLNRTELYIHPERSLSPEELSGFLPWIERRRRREPVAYITGQKEFWSLEFEVTPAVLIPRSETEILVEEALGAVSPDCSSGCRILEIGTGSGAVSIALACELKNAFVVATDLSPAAVSVADRNARRLGVRNRIAFLVGDCLQSLSGWFDIIVSNPPYISPDEFRRLPVDVAGFEPEMALIDRGDGTAFHEELIAGGRYLLKKGGWLFMEIGMDQKTRVETLFRESNGYDSIGFRKDYSGTDRVAKGRKC
jgi:release factor glutamine methyltransferase